MRDYNFFNTLIRAKKKAKLRKNLLSSVFAIVIVGIVASYVIIEYKAVEINKDVAIARNYLTSGEVGVRNAEIQKKKQKADVLGNYLKIVEASDNKVNNTFTLRSTFIASIDGTIPADVFFSSVAYTSSSFTAQCTSGSKASAAALYRSLYDLGYFDNVYIAGITKVSESPEKYSFSVQCAIKEGVAR